MRNRHARIDCNTRARCGERTLLVHGDVTGLELLLAGMERVSARNALVFLVAVLDLQLQRCGWPSSLRLQAKATSPQPRFNTRHSNASRRTQQPPYTPPTHVTLHRAQRQDAAKMPRPQRRHHARCRMRMHKPLSVLCPGEKLCFETGATSTDPVTFRRVLLVHIRGCDRLYICGELAVPPIPVGVPDWTGILLVNRGDEWLQTAGARCRARAWLR